MNKANLQESTSVLEIIARTIFEGCKREGIEEVYFNTPWEHLTDEGRRMYYDISRDVLHDFHKMIITPL